MVSILVPVAALAALQPGVRSLTTGEPGGELVTVRPLRPTRMPFPLTPPITLLLDPVSARRLRLYRWIVRIVPATGLMMVAGMIWAFNAEEYFWVWAFFAISLMVSLLARFLYPSVFPRVDAENTMVRLDGLDPDAVQEWLGVNRSAGISVLPQEATAPRTRRYFFGTKAMFFAIGGYSFLCMIIMSNVFEGGTREVSVDTEVFSWSAGDREDIKSLIEQAGGTLSVQCSGGGRLRLITITPVGEQKQLADVACDGIRNPVPYRSSAGSAR